MLPAALAANSPSCQPGAVRTPATQAAAPPPHLTLTQVLQHSLRSKPQWITCMQRWKQTTVGTQRQCG